MGWNPLDWKITDTIQGQEGGFDVTPGVLNNFSAAGNSFAGSGGTTAAFTNPTGQDYSSFQQAPSGQVQGATYTAPNFGGMQAGPIISTGPTQAQIDAQKEATRVANLMAGFQTGLNDINTTGANKAGQLESKYNLDITDYINSMRGSQTGIDNSRINNFANQQLGQRQVNQMVGEGIQSGGVMLANKNAGDSSATDAIARAYGQVGQNRMQGVNNQFEAGNRDVMAAQEQLNMTGAAQMNRMKEEAKMTAADIVSSARNELSALKQQQIGADLPTSIEIEQEIQGIIQRTNQAVAQIDSSLTNQAGTVQAIDTNSAQSRAFSNNNAGQGPTNYQNYTTNVPTNMRGGASVPSSLPIFTYRGNRNEG